MSLRDQLLKQGLATKKQARKADQEARQAKKKNKKKKKKKTDQDVEARDEISVAIEQKQQEQRERDRRLNQEIEEKRRAAEQQARIKEIIITHDLREQRADVPYYFIEDSRYIRCFQVTEHQLNKLAKGQLGIVTLKDEEYYLLDRDDCEKVREAREELILCLHESEPETA